MTLNFYSYGNIVRILSQNPYFFEKSIMVDVDIEEKKILSLFDAEKKFDADFIQSYLNILRESTVGFRLLSDSPADQSLRTRALNILSLNTSAHHKISSLLTRSELPN